MWVRAKASSTMWLVRVFLGRGGASPLGGPHKSMTIININSYRYLASFIGGAKKLSQQNEASQDLSKFLFHCNKNKAQIDNVGDMAEVDSFLSVLRRIKIGPSGQVAKMQNIVQGQYFLINKMPDQPSPEEQAIIAKVTMAREKTRAYKKGIGKEKQTVAAKKKEYVTKNLQRSAPKELVEFLTGEEVRTYVQEKASSNKEHLDVRR